MKGNIQTMTPEKQITAIAKVCGKLCRRCKGTGFYLRYGEHEWFRVNRSASKQPPVKCDHITPDEHRPFDRLYDDYLRDRGAIIKAIKLRIVGDLALEKVFLKKLNAIIERNADDDTALVYEWDMVLITADPAWYAEAFLRTLNLWEE
jgi:hypothetical protein